MDSSVRRFSKIDATQSFNEAHKKHTKTSVSPRNQENPKAGPTTVVNVGDSSCISARTLSMRFRTFRSAFTTGSGAIKRRATRLMTASPLRLNTPQPPTRTKMSRPPWMRFVGLQAYHRPKKHSWLGMCCTEIRKDGGDYVLGDEDVSTTR